MNTIPKEFYPPKTQGAAELEQGEPVMGPCLCNPIGVDGPSLDCPQHGKPDRPEDLTLLHGDGAPIAGAHDILQEIYALLGDYYCAVSDYWDSRSKYHLTNDGLYRRTKAYAAVCHWLKQQAEEHVKKLDEWYEDGRKLGCTEGAKMALREALSSMGITPEEKSVSGDICPSCRGDQTHRHAQGYCRCSR